jgi:hypothetical protein
MPQTTDKACMASHTLSPLLIQTLRIDPDDPSLEAQLLQVRLPGPLCR